MKMLKTKLFIRAFLEVVITILGIIIFFATMFIFPHIAFGILIVFTLLICVTIRYMELKNRKSQ